MYKRLFTPPKKHYFLFGPRSTGKSTWLKSQYQGAFIVNLLKTSELLKYSQNPSLFNETVRGFAGKTVVVDEIQRMPSLLTEVHDLISDIGTQKQFVLTGSSARKLKQSGVDLLAGRALTRHFFSLVSEEFEFSSGNFEVQLENVLRFGTLPEVRTAESEQEQGETLEAYAGTYIKEEIQQEALIRKLEPFSRFLQVAALMNGQRLNLSNIAREAEVKRPSVNGYFEVLEDTLIAFKLPAWQPKAKVKEVALPKYYFFDPGVVRALSGQIWKPLNDIERGFLLETFLLNEIRACVSYRSLRGTMAYWATPSGSEIDFVWGGQDGEIGVEIKSGRKWRSENHRSLEELLSAKSLKRAYGVYLGKEVLKIGKIEVLPVAEFLRRLWAGEIVG